MSARSSKAAPKSAVSIAFEDELAGLAIQERNSLKALESFRKLEAHFLRGVESGSLDYVQLSYLNRGLAEAALDLAAELQRTSACFAMARAIGDAASEAAE